MSEKIANKLISNQLAAGLVGGAAIGTLATLGALRVISRVRTLAADHAAARAAKAAVALAAKQAAEAKAQQRRAEAESRMSATLNRAFERLGLRLRAERVPGRD